MEQQPTPPLRQASILDRQEFTIDVEKIQTIDDVKAVLRAMDLICRYPVGKMPEKFKDLFVRDLVKDERIQEIDM